MTLIRKLFPTDQQKDWDTLQKLFHDARQMQGLRRREYLRAEVYPRLKEYCETYKIKYDMMNRPK